MHMPKKQGGVLCKRTRNFDILHTLAHFDFFVTNIRTSWCTFTGINNMGWCTKIIDMSYGREPYFYALLSSDPQLYFAFICYSHSSLLVMDKKKGGAIFLWNHHFHHRRRSTNISTANIKIATKMKITSSLQLSLFYC